MNKAHKQTRGVAVVLIVGALGSFLSQRLFNNKTSFDKGLMKAAEAVNKNCPIMLDAETRLDNTSGGPGRNFTYNYTLVNFTSDEINVAELKQHLKPRILNNIQTNPDLKGFRSMGVTIGYRYFDKTGKFIFELKFPPENYRRQETKPPE